MSLLNRRISEDYLNEIAFFLITGDQAPMSSVGEVYDLSAKSRDFFVRKLSEHYQRQQEEIEAARRG